MSTTAAPTCFLCGQRGRADAPLVDACHCTCSVRPVAGLAHRQCLVLAEPRQGDTSPTWRECPVCRSRGFGQAQLTRARQRFAAAQGDKLTDEWAKLGAAEELATALLASARDFPGALAVYDEALTVTRTERGERHPETLARTSQLAQLHLELGDADAALPLAQAALDGRSVVLGSEDIATVRSRSLLARVHLELGDADAALPLARDALAARRWTLGNDSAETMISVSQLAAVHQLSGHTEAALTLFEEDLAFSRRTLGDRHPDTLTACHNLGLCRCEVAGAGAGLALLREAAAGRLRVLGESHPRTQRALDSLRTWQGKVSTTAAAATKTEGDRMQAASTERSARSSSPTTPRRRVLALQPRPRPSQHIQPPPSRTEPESSSWRRMCLCLAAPPQQQPPAEGVPPQQHPGSVSAMHPDA